MVSGCLACAFVRGEHCCNWESDRNVCPSLQCSRAAWCSSLIPDKDVSPLVLWIVNFMDSSMSTSLFLLPQLHEPSYPVKYGENHMLEKSSKIIKSSRGMVLTVSSSCTGFSHWTDVICFALRVALFKNYERVKCSFVRLSRIFYVCEYRYLSKMARSYAGVTTVSFFEGRLFYSQS